MKMWMLLFGMLICCIPKICAADVIDPNEFITVPVCHRIINVRDFHDIYIIAGINDGPRAYKEFKIIKADECIYSKDIGGDFYLFWAKRDYIDRVGVGNIKMQVMQTPERKATRNVLKFLIDDNMHLLTESLGREKYTYRKAAQSRFRFNLRKGEEDKRSANDVLDGHSSFGLKEKRINHVLKKDANGNFSLSDE